jgi:hypothetical protein
MSDDFKAALTLLQMAVDAAATKERLNELRARRPMHGRRSRTWPQLEPSMMRRSPEIGLRSRLSEPRLRSAGQKCAGRAPHWTLTGPGSGNFPKRIRRGRRKYLPAVWFAIGARRKRGQRTWL